MIKLIKDAVGGVSLTAWLCIGLAAAALTYHLMAVSEARRVARLELKAAIEEEAARTGRAADAASRNVLDCAGVWNRRLGRCEP